MPKLKYTGAAPIFGTAITGKAERWFPGQCSDVSDADALLYLAAGNFTQIPPSDVVLPGVTVLTTDYTVTAADDGRSFACSTALTVTFPQGLSPRPSVYIMPPATGNLTIARGGSATLNGLGTSIVATRANNWGGVCVVALLDSDGYGCKAG